MAHLYEQFRLVLRRLARAPLFSIIVLLTLALVIAANTVVFSVVEGVLLKPLNYPRSEELIGVWYKAPGVGLPNIIIGSFLYLTDRDQNKTLQDVGAYRADSVSVTGIGQPEHTQSVTVTDGTLPLLGVRPMLGRLFTRRDDSAGAPKTVILSYGYWQKRFGGNRSAIGRSLTVDGSAHEIIGVLPRDFRFLDETDASLYIPMQIDRNQVKLGNFNYEALARLKPGVTLEQASADIGRMVPIAIHSYPAPEGFSTKVFESAQIQPNLKPLKKVVVGDIGNVLWVLMGSIAMVLLIACANIANLLLVRAEGRHRELAIRSALGASRSSIASELLLESMILSLAGTMVGLGVAFAALRILVATAPAGLPRISEIGIDSPVLLFSLGLALVVGLVIGLIPVLKYSRVQTSTGLREGGRSLSQSRERHRARKTLVIIQVSLALVLLICSGLMIRTFRAMVRVSPGFTDPASLETFSIYIPETQIPDTQKERVLRTQQAIADKLAAIPGVRSVSISTSIPLNGDMNFNPVAAADHFYKDGELPPLRAFKYIGPGTFATMGTPLVAGRDVTWAEEYEKRPVAIVSENFAREYWGTAANALGKRVREAQTEDWHEVIGVARDVYYDGVSQPASSIAYWPLYQDHFNGDKEMMRRSVNFILRTPRAGSAALFSEMQRAVWAVDPDLPLADAKTVGDLYRKSMARTSFTLVILCVAGSMALLLGVLGIYGVIAYAVSQRSREISIRLALGARRETVTSMFVLEGLSLTGIGVAIGLVVAFLTMRLMSSLLFNVPPVDPWTYALATGCVLVIAALASYLPSRRATTIDVVEGLRAE
ncbi:MAG: ABC transporter permease [Terracidiphilus sp.]